MADAIDALLRERESAKAAVTDEMVERAVDARIEIISRKGRINVSDNAAMRAALEAVAPMLASARVPEAELIALKNLAYDMRQQAGNNNRLTHIGWAQRVERVITMLAAAPKPETIWPKNAREKAFSLAREMLKKGSAKPEKE